MNKDISILIVDDNETIRMVMRRMLEKNGCKNIHETCDGQSAFKLVKSRKIDLIIADWNMEGMTGLELLKKVRQDNDISKTPFIIVSVEGLDVSVNTAFQCDVSDFLSKPFTVEAFLGSIEKTMQMSP